uniref:Uncharacterized protein n=1 Tax=Mus spicilegus TaxID=10103 RepID=A0A8C6GNK7_MUSSI
MNWHDARRSSNMRRIVRVRQGDRAPSNTLGFCSLVSMGGPITSWALYHPKCSIKAVGESATGRGGRLQQQWQQMKKRVRTTTRGNPRSTARQTVLKTPLSCLIRMVSQTELKKELFLSMVLA